ncbi:MAG: hypothetical protein M1546_20935 [Chloroflexi bacterium]|nr:hypothetical protein [Chloroflexota bacterium]
MERDVLSRKSPLYGRATTLIKLRQLSYGALTEIFPTWSPAERVIGAFWTQYRGKAVQLDVVAASRREKRLFIGEAKWGEEPLSRHILADLVERSRHMPQVAEGWRAEYALFSRGGFTDAARQAAQEIGARLVDLPQMERALFKASRAET